MVTLLYSPQFRTAISGVTRELDMFFQNIHLNHPPLTEYRRNFRHLNDLEYFKGRLNDLGAGKVSIWRGTIGSILLKRKTYIVAQGPWRGYFRKRDDGTLVGLLFMDCR